MLSTAARRFEVSVRTVERDLDALRQSGVPLFSEPGRSGGYAIDRDRTLPPLALTAAEALAISVALRESAGSPFAEAAASGPRSPGPRRSRERRSRGGMDVLQFAGGRIDRAWSWTGQHAFTF